MKLKINLRENNEERTQDHCFIVPILDLSVHYNEVIITLPNQGTGAMRTQANAMAEDYGFTIEDFGDRWSIRCDKIEYGFIIIEGIV